MSLLLVLSLGAGAQEDEPLQTYLREVMTAEDVESSTWEDVYDQLCYLAQHPLDLNTSTRAQLEELPFLSAQQIEECLLRGRGAQEVFSPSEGDPAGRAS